jgi:PAS domain S-box-containing protein
MIADITRGGNQRILQDPQQLLKKILASLHGAVFILDATTAEILDCNPAASEMFGYSRDEMLGQTTTFLHVDESSLEEFRTQLYTAMKVEGFLNLPEFQMKRKNGEIFFTDQTVISLEDDRGIRIGWVSVVRDITKHKQTMEALRESEQRFRQLAENIEVVFWMESPNGNEIHYISPAFEKIWGSSIEDLMRDRNLWVKAIHPDDSPRVLSWLEGHKRGEAFHVEEFRIIRPDGEIRWVSDCAFPVRNEKGEFYKVAGFAEDITRRKQAEKALQERTLELQQLTETLQERVKERTAELELANKKLKDSESRLRHLSARLLEAQEEERRRFAGELHDSIVASLGGMKFRIEKMGEEVKQGHANPEALQGLGSMVSEINNDVRRIMADLRPAVLDDLGIIAALNWLCREYQKTYSHISVETQIGVSEHEVPDSLKTPIFRISQEAMNNIAKHSQASLVNLSLRKEDDKVLLKIQDNGQGFDLDTIRRGMGISTMRERARLSGGSFDLESAIGKGTIIHVSWPFNILVDSKLSEREN